MVCRDGTDGRTIVYHYTYNGCTQHYFEVGDLPHPTN